MSQIKNLSNSEFSKPIQLTSYAAIKKKFRSRPSLKRVDPHLVSLTAPESFEAEQYRILRYAVECTHKQNQGLVIGVCSALPGDGKSTTAINLAGALAQNPKTKTLLIEADLRRPSVSVGDQLALGNMVGHGLVDAILDPSFSLEEVVLHLKHFNLSVLPAGRQSAAPYEALGSPRFSELIMQARQCYDYVILDTSPIIPVPDSRLLANYIDSFIMVIAAHRTPREAIQEALALLMPEKILGLVFNHYSRPAKLYYGRGKSHSSVQREVRWWNRLSKK